MKIALLCLLLVATSVYSQERRFGWRGDDGQKRVTMMMPGAWEIEEPAAQSDLSAGMPKVLNQGNLGSCVANAAASAWSYALKRERDDHLWLSRLMIYYEARKAIGTTSWDSGCQIVDAVRWMERWGASREKTWPYDIWKYRQKAPNAAYSEAKSYKAIETRKLANTDGRSIRLALTNGHPVIVGSMVYSGMMNVTRANPVMAMPRRGERPLGGHAYLLTGHDDRTGLYRARNSWGTSYGKGGDFWVPYDYIHSGRITEDCWVVLSVLSAK